jgi:CRP-like cAMP-binding protein
VEAALQKPSEAGLQALLALKDVPAQPRSSLVPADGVPRLADTSSPQLDLTREARMRTRERGAALRAFPALSALSETEASTLAPLLDEVAVRPTVPVLKHGEPTDALYLISEGVAEVRRPESERPIELGRGDCFGEIALLTGSRRTADVTARSALRLLRVDRRVYLRYLRELDDVDRQLYRIALTRAARP